MEWASVFRTWAGVVIKDIPRYLLAVLGSNYLALSNRYESLELAPDRTGFRCQWKWTSDLHAPTVVHSLGALIMKRALRDHPIRMSPAPDPSSSSVDVTFIIGHRGAIRLPHLLMTLQSIAAQRNVRVECVVVEQDTVRRLDGCLPSWVRHEFLPSPDINFPYCRSWTLNFGARQARGRLLVLHDNDILVSDDYAHLSLVRFDAGYEVVDLKRFGFYLSEAHTARVFAGTSGLIDRPAETIRQNQTAGATIAIGREAFFQIGGMDEAFVGWGGEDNEFWDRAETLRAWPFGCLPIVHLWHPAQPRKGDDFNPTLVRYQNLLRIPSVDRIATLLDLPQGESSGPSGYSSLFGC